MLVLSGHAAVKGGAASATASSSTSRGLPSFPPPYHHHPSATAAFYATQFLLLSAAALPTRAIPSSATRMTKTTNLSMLSTSSSHNNQHSSALSSSTSLTTSSSAFASSNQTPSPTTATTSTSTTGATNDINTTPIRTSTSLGATRTNTDDDGNGGKDDGNDNAANPSSMSWPLPPRARSVAYMACAMTLHFAGYEFLRNALITLFTSKDLGFGQTSSTTAVAFSLANSLVSPFSVLLLNAYSLQLERSGPRIALRRTTLACMIFLAGTASLLYACQLQLATAVATAAEGGATMMMLWSRRIGQAVVGLAFLFQNSYQYLIYTQQWSFVGSVLTPSEAARWFGPLAAACSGVCTLAAGSLVPALAPQTGLLGLILVAAFALSFTAASSDRAYALAQTHGFDPSQQQQEEKQQQQEISKTQDSKSATEDSSLLQQQQPPVVDDDEAYKAKEPPLWYTRWKNHISLFRRVPTLAAMLSEVLSYNALLTILNVAFVSRLRQQIPNDLARSAYVGRFYAAISGVATILQLIIVPSLLKVLEPALLWRILPVAPLMFCLAMPFIRGGPTLWVLGGAFFMAKTLDYSLRSVISMMAYQPLDFESRYVGKEVIGVLGSRLGKSAMSLLLGAGAAVGFMGGGMTAWSAATVGLVWSIACSWIAKSMPPKAAAQAIVEARHRAQQLQRQQQQQQQTEKEPPKVEEPTVQPPPPQDIIELENGDHESPEEKTPHEGETVVKQSLPSPPPVGANSELDNESTQLMIEAQQQRDKEQQQAVAAAESGSESKPVEGQTKIVPPKEQPVTKMNTKSDSARSKNRRSRSKGKSAGGSISKEKLD